MFANKINMCYRHTKITPALAEALPYQLTFQTTVSIAHEVPTDNQAGDKHGH